MDVYIYRSYGTSNSAQFLWSSRLLHSPSHDDDGVLVIRSTGDCVLEGPFI